MPAGRRHRPVHLSDAVTATYRRAVAAATAACVVLALSACGEPPPSAFWAESSSAYERDAPTVVVDVRVRKDQAWRLNQVFGRGTVAGAERVDEADHAGTIRLRIRLAYPEHDAMMQAPNTLSEAPSRFLLNSRRYGSRTEKEST